MTDKNVANFKIPVPWDSNRPQFDGRTASSLKRFLRNLKEIFEKGKITEDIDRKQRTVDYLTDEDTRQQWEALPHFESGTFKDWVAEIQELFPELEDDRVGSLAKLEKICKDAQGIEVQDLGGLRRFSASFLNEANKLLLAPAAIN
ncbi:hypothetical protein B0H19DRAFT_940940, partial [Mycena capillaripes]